MLGSLSDQQRDLFMDAIQSHENLTVGTTTINIYNPFGQ